MFFFRGRGTDTLTHIRLMTIQLQIDTHLTIFRYTWTHIWFCFFKQLHIDSHLTVTMQIDTRLTIFSYTWAHVWLLSETVTLWLISDHHEADSDGHTLDNLWWHMHLHVTTTTFWDSYTLTHICLSRKPYRLTHIWLFVITHSPSCDYFWRQLHYYCLIHTLWHTSDYHEADTDWHTFDCSSVQIDTHLTFFFRQLHIDTYLTMARQSPCVQINQDIEICMFAYVWIMALMKE